MAKTFTKRELEDLLANADLKTRLLTRKKQLSLTEVSILASIALAESSGNPDAMNANSTATGLWQIMWSVWKDDPDMKTIGVTDRNSLKNPERNAQAAIIVYHKQGFKAWEVYNSGAYKKVKDSTPADKLGSAIDTVSDVPNAIKASVNSLGDTFMKIGLNALGITVAVVFIILGFIILSRNSLGKNAVGAITRGVV
jgi:Transglycosylase SLT domain